MERDLALVRCRRGVRLCRYRRSGAADCGAGNRMPNGSAPELRIVEGETGTISLLELGTHGFVPALRDGGTAVVDVLDMNEKPHRRLDRVKPLSVVTHFSQTRNRSLASV